MSSTVLPRAFEMKSPHSTDHFRAVLISNVPTQICGRPVQLSDVLRKVRGGALMCAVKAEQKIMNKSLAVIYVVFTYADDAKWFADSATADILRMGESILDVKLIKTPTYPFHQHIEEQAKNQKSPTSRCLRVLLGSATRLDKFESLICITDNNGAPSYRAHYIVEAWYEEDAGFLTYHFSDIRIACEIVAQVERLDWARENGVLVGFAIDPCDRQTSRSVYSGENLSTCEADCGLSSTANTAAPMSWIGGTTGLKGNNVLCLTGRYLSKTLCIRQLHFPTIGYRGYGWSGPRYHGSSVRPASAQSLDVCDIGMEDAAVHIGHRRDYHISCTAAHVPHPRQHKEEVAESQSHKTLQDQLFSELGLDANGNELPSAGKGGQETN